MTGCRGEEEFGRGESHGCISVVNAIFTGTGAVIGVNLATSAQYRGAGDGQSVDVSPGGVDDTLARICVRRALERVGEDPEGGYELCVVSEIPPSRGLKSSSSACNAVIKAVLDYHGFEMDAMDVILLGVECAREAGVTVTGSFDDACGCELGGFIVADNVRNRVLIRRPAEDLDVMISVPDSVKGCVPPENYRALAPEMEEVLSILDEDPYRAMTLNGRLVARAANLSGTVADRAMGEGALAASFSGTGPAVAALVGKGQRPEFFDDPLWGIRTETRRWGR